MKRWRLALVLIGIFVVGGVTLVSALLWNLRDQIAIAAIHDRIYSHH